MSGRPTGTWFVYVLRCADGTLYTGIATDLARKTKQHNAGTASRYTRSRRPVHVMYRERQCSQSLALKREAAIKRLTWREKVVLIGVGEIGRADSQSAFPV